MAASTVVNSAEETNTYSSSDWVVI